MQRLNPKPRNKLEWKWYYEHQTQLKRAKETNTCPSCGRSLIGIMLYDRGYRYGLECEYCR